MSIIKQIDCLLDRRLFSSIKANQDAVENIQVVMDKTFLSTEFPSIIEYTRLGAAFSYMLARQKYNSLVVCSNKASKEWLDTTPQNDPSTSSLFVNEEIIPAETCAFPASPEGGWKLVIINDIHVTWHNEDVFSTLLSNIKHTMAPNGCMLIASHDFNERKDSFIKSIDGVHITQRMEKIRTRQFRRSLIARADEFAETLKEEWMSWADTDIHASINDY